MIVGGFNVKTNKMSNEIYYCVSNDINIKNNQSIWQLCLIKLPLVLSDCQCIITDQKSNNPKLIILGGNNENNNNIDTYLVYNLCDMIGYDTFNHFIIDMRRVYKTIFLILLEFD